jgi:hypothetical protein
MDFFFLENSKWRYVNMKYYIFQKILRFYFRTTVYEMFSFFYMLQLNAI